MKIFIDADGCPVVRLTVKIANEFNIKCVIVCDTAHYFDIDGTEVITVSQGADSADYKIVNSLNEKDIVITQDYGLACMCLAKKAIILNQNGFIYNESNIDSLLSQRYISGKIRRSGAHTKGPKKRTTDQDEKFERAFREVLKKTLGE